MASYHIISHTPHTHPQYILMCGIISTSFSQVGRALGYGIISHHITYTTHTPSIHINVWHHLDELFAGREGTGLWHHITYTSHTPQTHPQYILMCAGACDVRGNRHPIYTLSTHQLTPPPPTTTTTTHTLHVSMCVGACDGMTYEEIEEQFPEEFVRREKDKLAYRYPRGESCDRSRMGRDCSSKLPLTHAI